MTRFQQYLVYLILAGALACTPAVDEHIAPDTVLINGTLLTVDTNDSIAEALAIKDGKIIAMGTNNMVEALVGPRTRVIDLKGATATPGLIDSHCHFSGSGMLYMVDLSYPSVKSITEVVEKVKTQVETIGPDEWVQGRGWDEGKLSELRYILASDLDPVSPGNPVWLEHTMGHYDVYRKQVLLFHNAGLHVSTHAIGDRAIDWTVDSYALALKEKPTPGLRHGIIHCNIPTEEAIRKMAE